MLLKKLESDFIANTFKSLWLCVGLIGVVVACQPASSTYPQRSVPDSVATNPAFFEKQELMVHLTDPMELAVAEDGRVFVVERGGAIHRWDPVTNESKRIGYIPVYMIIEDGLLGLALDPDFSGNGWLYVFYGPADGSDSRLSRFTVANDFIDPVSEKIILHVPMQREACCHAAGSLAFGPDGTLYLAVGDNTDHIDTAGGPIDERAGHHIADAQLTSSNTNDLRGKILRIKPEPDGTYSIPDGNLFKGDDLHRPEIYAMGLRNPFRISIDTETGWLYFGDVGNGDPPNERGDWGWDEFNQARGPGNFGWPYITGNNQPYRDFDYATQNVGEPFNPMQLVNNSPNNSGAEMLPPAQPAMIWYTFGESTEFPALGAGGINPMAGPVYRRAASHTDIALPDYYIGKHLIYDWMRNWVQLVSFDEAGNYESIEPFLPEITFARPMDMEVGPDGVLYVIEWGKGFWGSNSDAKVVRVAYHGTDAFTRWRSPEDKRENDVRIILEEPANGSFFEFDKPLRYRVSLANDNALDLQRLRVQTLTGFDTNAFMLEEQNTPEGQTTITRAYTHVPDLHFTDRFAEIKACVRANTAKEICRSSRLHPYYKEAEHASHTENVSRHTYGIQPASADFAETALTVMRVKNGGVLSFDPLNLAGISALKIRYKPVEDAILSLIADPHGQLARLDLSKQQGNELPELSQATVLDRLKEDGKGHVIERLARTSYQGWRELTIELNLSTDEETSSLHLKAEGKDDGVLLEIDALEFIRY